MWLQFHLASLCTRAAQISFAKQSLLRDHNRALLQVKKKTQIHRVRRPKMLGGGKAKEGAKVMSYEDLEEAQAKRDAKDKAAAKKKARVRAVASGKLLYKKSRRINLCQYERIKLLGGLEFRSLFHGGLLEHKCINI